MRDERRDNNPPRLLKVCGSDFELGNFVRGRNDAGGSGPEASRALLAAISGLPRRTLHHCSSPPSNWQSVVYGGRQGGGILQYSCSTDDSDHPQDWGRKFLAENGGCAYIDLDHLELCSPEVSNAWDFVAATHAMLRIARHALHIANDEQTDGCKIQVLVNNSDGLGHSYGSHLNFLITQRAWDNIFNRKFHYLQYLASFQVSSLIYTGQGKVGAENGAPDVAFQLSQRAEFFEKLSSLPTTFSRGLVNSRDEPLCGPTSASSKPDAPARLHSIFFDSTLAHGSCLLKVGVMQIVLAMLEAEHCDPALILDDPVDAAMCISHDPTLKQCVELVSGARLTAIELQGRFLADARRFAATVGFEGVVPRSAEVLDLWEDTLTKLKAGDLLRLAPRLDWVMKLMALERALDQRPELGWDSPEIKVLDHLYSSLDDDGLYWAYEKCGFAERLVDDDHITRLATTPPEDTRAWTRAMLLRCGGTTIDSVDWDSVGFKLRGKNYWPTYRKVSLGHPLAFTRAKAEPLFTQAENLEAILDAIDAASGHAGDERIPLPPDSVDKPREFIN
ncbi:MAG: proteasome accessory factor PafA2 family protein [Candidatus Korobacteraceae bacterium]